MSVSKHTEAQIIGALKQLEAGRKAEDVAREVGQNSHPFRQRGLAQLWSRDHHEMAAPRFAGFEAWAFVPPTSGDFSHSHLRSRGAHSPRCVRFAMT